jgi:hypothetical protein
VRKGYTKAIEALNPGFCYADEGDGSPPNPQKAFFYISFFAQGGSPENSGPVYIGLSWLEADQNWALKYLISDEWVAFRTLF